MTGFVDRTVEAGIARITIDRSARSNSLIPELLEQLIAGFDTLRGDRSVRVVALSAVGENFSTGGDIGAFWDHCDDLDTYARHLVGLVNQTILAMTRHPVPIVSAVQGMVTGGSLGLVAASDVVIVEPATTLTPWYGVVGFAPDGGWTALAPSIIGRSRTMRALATNRPISAADAVAWGLATEMVPSEHLRRRQDELAAEIATMKPGSMAAAKRLLEPAGLEDALERERASFVAQIATEEARSGMAAFLGITP